MKKIVLNEFEKDFLELLEEVYVSAKKYGIKFETYEDLDKLFLGNVIAGYYSLEKALCTLQSNYKFYQKLNSESENKKVLEKFAKALVYAKENAKYSLLKDGKHERYNPSFNPSILLINKND